jgi:hypothetical protein
MNAPPRGGTSAFWMPLLRDSGESSFAEIMKQSFREGLSGVIGKSGMEAVFFNFKLDGNLMNPKAIHASLLPAFKEHGAEILEKAVLKELYKRIDVQFAQGTEDFRYEEMFNRARAVFVAKQIRE